MDSRPLSAYVSGDYQASCKNYAPLVITRSWSPVGAAAGGLIGYLLDHGLTQTEASYYHERVAHGAALVIVRAEGRASEAQAIMQRHGAHDFHSRPVA